MMPLGYNFELQFEDSDNKVGALSLSLPRPTLITIFIADGRELIWQRKYTSN